MNSRLQTSPGITIQGFKSEERAGHAVVLPHPIRRSGDTLFTNSRTARRKCGGAPSCMNHKRIPVSRSTSCNKEYRMDLRLFVWQLEFISESHKHCSDVQFPALNLRVYNLNIFFNTQQAVTRKVRFRRPLFLKCFLYCGVDAYYVGLIMHFSSTLHISLFPEYSHSHCWLGIICTSFHKCGFYNTKSSSFWGFYEYFAVPWTGYRPVAG